MSAVNHFYLSIQRSSISRAYSTAGAGSAAQDNDCVRFLKVWAPASLFVTGFQQFLFLQPIYHRLDAFLLISSCSWSAELMGYYFPTLVKLCLFTARLLDVAFLLVLVINNTSLDMPAF